MTEKIIDFKKYKRPPHPNKSPAKYVIGLGAGLAIVFAGLTAYLMWSGNMIGLATFAAFIFALWLMRKGQNMQTLAQEKWDKGQLH